MNPDKDTENRIKNLAYVGTALDQSRNGKTEDTAFYLAKQALINFKEGIDKLNLDIESKDGMEDLINYLDNEIDKKMSEAI